jgi:FkbM family methyltransferase
MRNIKNFIKALLPEFVKTYYRNIIKDIKPNKLKARFYSQFIGKNDLCFDVGANIGNKVKPFLMNQARVLAIEPQDSCVEILENKFGKKITIVNKGVGEKEEVKDFFIANRSVLSTFSSEFIDKIKEDRFKDSNWNKTVEKEITTLDKLIAQYGKPKFIKIDVEGFEVNVLKGLNSPVESLSFEYTYPEFKENAIACVNILNNITDKYVFNYCISESLNFASKDWLSAFKMLAEIEKIGNFPGWGDIYVKLNSST